MHFEVVSPDQLQGNTEWANSWRILIAKICVVVGILVLVLIILRPVKTSVPNFWNPAVQVPCFHDVQDLRKQSDWNGYLDYVYGASTLVYPLCLTETIFFYGHKLPPTFESQIRVLMEHSHRDQKSCGEVKYDFPSIENDMWCPDAGALHAFCPDKKPYWIASSIKFGYTDGVPDNHTIEVMHSCCDIYAVGFWMYAAPGSGIHYNVGRTYVHKLGPNEETGSKTSHCIKLLGNDTRCSNIILANILVRVEARKRGYDSIQYCNVFCCGTKSWIDARHEIVDLRDGWNEEFPRQDWIFDWDFNQFSDETFWRKKFGDLALFDDVMYRSPCHRNMDLFRSGWNGTQPCACDIAGQVFNCQGKPTAHNSMLQLQTVAH